MRQENWLTQRRVLAAGLLLVAILSTAISFFNPLFEPPDELQHYQFVRYLVDNQALPVQSPDGPISQSHQPPLYYLGGALLVAGIDDPQTLPERNPFWAYYAADEVSQDNKLQFIDAAAYAFPYTGTALVMHVLRLWSVALSLGTVTAVWLLGRALWPRNPVKVALLLAFSVLNPMFLYIAGAVNNDNMVILWGAIILWLAVKALSDNFSWRTTVLIGLVWGLALLSKLTGLILAAPWGIALAWAAWQKRSASLFTSRLVSIGGLAAVLSGAWFVHNLRTYGEPFALETMLSIWGSRTADQFTLAHFQGDILYAWTNFWGRFGYGQAPLPNGFYLFFLLLCVLAFSGGVRKWRMSWRHEAESFKPVWLVSLGTTLAFTAAFVYYLVRSSTGANGRYIFPALAALAALMTAGISVWFKQRQSLYLILVTVIAGIAIYTAAIFLPWTYAQPDLLTEAEAMAQIDNPANLVFGEGIRLLGTAVSPPEVMTGETVNITACWQALAAMDQNYTRYIRLLDHEQNSLGQRDTYPGLGAFPTTLWQVGDLFCDTTPIQVAKNLPLPVVAEIEIGYRNLATDEILPVAPVNRAVVGQVKIRPSAPPPTPILQQKIDARFEQGITLIGYNWSMENTAVNNTIAVELIWQASGPLPHSYTVFAHLLDKNGQLIAQDDSLPRDGAYPTAFWADGDLIVDTHHLTLPSDAPPGATSLRVGLYRLEDFSRLPRLFGSETNDSVEFAGPVVTKTQE